LRLNRGEFRHILAKSLFFANLGGFRSGDYEEVMNKASCLSLLSNAVLVWNTVHISRTVDQLRAAEHQVADEELVRVSPLAHVHVIPNGSYFQSLRRRAQAGWSQRRAPACRCQPCELATDQPEEADRKHDR
jgi:hypothetical protein